MRTRKRRQQNKEEEGEEQREETTCSHVMSSTTTSANNKTKRQQMIVASTLLLIITSAQSILVQAAAASNNRPSSGVRFSPDSNAYSGLTFSFDPRLDKRVEWLHFEHWLAIMHQSSELLHEALNGRAHLAEVRVLIPYKWRNVQWPVLNKPGAPIIMNRRLRYTDSDVIVGFDDPNYKETPFAVQHDECARRGLHISMPISFLEEGKQQQQQQQSNQDPKLKARLLVREFASHRYGLFKESGFRNDYMYPPFTSLAGYSAPHANKQRNNRTMLSGEGWLGGEADGFSVKGFDQDWNECSFDTQPQNGLPTSQSTSCLPYLTRASSMNTTPQSSDKQTSGQSFNLMSADPFSHADLSARFAQQQQQQRPVQWRDLSDSIKWHFCGDNFPATAARSSPIVLNDLTATRSHTTSMESYAHNQKSVNKQNVLCQERSAMEIIKASEDFKRQTFSPSTFNRLPAPNFSFLQEMPPRVILCVEYAAHLFQSRRLDHGILEAAIGKFFAYDLIADSELALVLFGQRNSSRQSFERLDESIKSRLTLYNPAIDPFDEPVRYYSESELSQIFGHSGATDSAAANQQQQQAKIVKGTCSFAKLMHEVAALQQQRSHQYDDVGADIVIISSGLFVEDEPKIEEIIRAQFKPDAQQINLIVYPSTMLFDTKSHEGFVVLDALESDAIVKNRLAKLLLIERLTNARIHLVKEHLDANGDVKMSTLIQFYQIFDQISKGHSWDQQQSTVLLAHESVVDTQRGAPNSATSNRLSFQFQVDASIQTELIVAFIDPKQSQQSLKPGKRFSIRNLQLRSPDGQLVLTDSHPWPMSAATLNHHHHNHHHQVSSESFDGSMESGMLTPESRAAVAASADSMQQDAHEQHPAAGGSSTLESALFPYRNQLGLAGFHLKASHLALLANSSSSSLNGRISGTWTLSATCDEQLQTSAIAMARVNPAGDTITSSCWIQTYHDSSPASTSANEDEPETAAEATALRAVKVFVHTRGPAGAGPVQEIAARLEVQDEMGNIVQNVNMLDDGLSAPDITRGDGIHTQFVRQRAHRPGYYKVSVELTGSKSPHHSAKHGKPNSSSSGLGQDAPCCGSFAPSTQVSTRHLSRQLYCGTFYVEPNNKLGQQRPPRVNNLTVLSVDQDARQLTLGWSEPTSDASSSPALRFARSNAARSQKRRSNDADELEPTDFEAGSGAKQQQHATEPGNRYEIKLFSDRDILKRSFDSGSRPDQLEVGYKFSELNVVGDSFPNASTYGGAKEVTLRLPNGRQGIYYIAMRVYNNQGIGSQVSNIVEFWVRSNMTEQEEVESIWGPAVTVDANGNVYDKTGELVGQRGPNGFGPASSSSSTVGGPSGGLLRGVSSSTLEGLSALLFISACALLFSIVCISLLACLIGSARRSLKAKQDPNDKLGGCAVKRSGGTGSGAAILAGSGSSSVVSSTSQCEASSRTSSGHGDSLGTGSVVDADGLGGEGDDMSKLADHLSYSQLRHQHQLQQQQASQIKNAYLQHQQAMAAAANNQQWLQHTIVNGYAYATISGQQQQQPAYDVDLVGSGGDLNQNGLWTTARQNDLDDECHYDKLKQPGGRVELLDHGLMNGLPQVPDEFEASASYLIRNSQHQHSQLPSYFNQQLQQQLSSVLKSKQQQQEDASTSSPALEGVAQEGHEASPGYGGSGPPPPVQYIYQCTEANIGQQTEPTIYSQATGLQQVTAADTGYYANTHLQQQQHYAQQQASNIYGSMDPYNQQQPGLLSENCLEESYDKPNSAISEV